MPTVVLTRPQGKNEALAAALQEQGLSTLLLPALQVSPTISALPERYLPVNFDLHYRLLIDQQTLIYWFL